MPLAYALEQKSEHPLAHADARDGLRNAGPQGAGSYRLCQALPGNGLTADAGRRGALPAATWPLSPGGRRFPADMRAQADQLGGGRQDAAVLQPGMGSCWASLPWPTPSRKTARRLCGSFRTWASAWSCSPATTSAPPEAIGTSGRRGRGHRRACCPDGKESVIRSLQVAGQGSHGGRRHQRRSRAHPRGHRHRHRRGHGRGH